MPSSAGHWPTATSSTKFIATSSTGSTAALPARTFALRRMLTCLALLAIAATASCSRAGRDDDTIRITGSDTMVNLAQAWAEAYQKSHPDISAVVRGGGSGVGIAALINGRIDIAPASRAMNPHEREQAKKNTGQEPKEFIVGTDALAIYVHKDNPLDTISMDELAEVYGERGKISKWKELGVDNPACASDEIIRISRQNNSGTYVYFRDEVLGKDRQYKQGTTAQSGSADVVALVANTPCALGYSGMGYFEADKVKMLKVAPKKGQPGVAPTLATALDGTYPIARPLYIYTLGEPTGAVLEFIQWMLGPEGQAVVREVGYVPNELAASPASEPAAGNNEAPNDKPAADAAAKEPAAKESAGDAPPAAESSEPATPAPAAESPVEEKPAAESPPTEAPPAETTPTETPSTPQ